MSATDRTASANEPLFPRLTAGRGAPSAERVAQHQRARLMGAMVEAVSRHGYPESTVRELVTLAGISKSAFYDHFENKQECFLATFDEIVTVLQGRVEAAYRTEGDFRERLGAALSVFLALAVEEPAAATLAAVDSLTLGVPGMEHRERASEGFEALVAQSFEHSPSSREMSPSTIKAVVAGIRGVTYRHLRAGTQAELPGLVDLIVDWALGYQRAEGKLTLRAMAAADDPAPEPPSELTAKISWEEPPGTRRSRRDLTPRERMLRAAARLVVEGGYESLAIPTISSTAAVSNKTFYEQFGSKRKAFLAAFDEIADEAKAVTGAAMAAAERPEALGIGMRSLLEFIAGNALFARLAFFELLSAGPLAMDRADAVLDAFTVLLDDPAGEDPLPGPIKEAIGSGIWAVIQHEIHHGRRAQLPELAPELVRLALLPSERSWSALTQR